MRIPRSLRFLMPPMLGFVVACGLSIGLHAFGPNGNFAALCSFLNAPAMLLKEIWMNTDWYPTRFYYLDDYFPIIAQWLFLGLSAGVGCVWFGRFQDEGTFSLRRWLEEHIRDFVTLLREEKEPTLYVSYFCGVAAWALIVLRFTPVLGNSVNSVFWFVPVTVLGIVTGVASHFRCRNKGMARFAIWISSLSIG